MVSPQSPEPGREVPPIADILRAFTATTPLGFYLVLDGVITWANPQFEHDTGYSVAELAGRSPLELVHPEDRAYVRQRATEMLKGLRREPYRYRCMTKEGNVLWVVETVSSMPWGGRRATVGNFLNVTVEVRLREESELVQQQRNEALGELQAVFDATNDGMALIAPDQRIVRVNRRFSELFAVPADDLVGRRLPDIDALVRRVFTDPDAFLRWIRAESWRESGESTAAIFAQQLPEARELEVRVAPVTRVAAGPLGQLYTFRDVTQERAADRVKSEFVSLVSHELRTPLTSIKGYADLLIDGEVGDLTDEQREFTGIIKNNADRLVALVNDLLDIARTESGSVELHLAPVEVRQAIEAVAVSFAPQMEAKGQQLSVQIATDLPAVLADADRLAQILVNLVSNAHKYTPAGGAIQIMADQAGDVVGIAVRDTGIGLSTNEQARLFTKFFRAANPVVQAAGGTGLGLAITRALVERHGGELSVSSTPGSGSTFRFTLPRARAPTAPASVAHPPASGRLLVVEDEPDIASLLRRYLERGGYQVLATDRGEGAIALAVAEQPDLVILDVMLPDQDGFSVLQRLQADPRTSAIPVMLVSMLPDEGYGRQLGAIDYLQKPVTERELLDRVGHWLGEVRALAIDTAKHRP